MDNLFHREKETWSLWWLIGLLGAVAIFFIAKYSNGFLAVFIALLVLLMTLTWRMAITRRYSFWRALRVSKLVFLLTSSPILLFNFESIALFNGIDIEIKMVLMLAIAMIVSTLCAVIAKQPKQYY